MDHCSVMAMTVSIVSIVLCNRVIVCLSFMSMGSTSRGHLSGRYVCGRCREYEKGDPQANARSITRLPFSLCLACGTHRQFDVRYVPNRTGHALAAPCYDTDSMGPVALCHGPRLSIHAWVSSSDDHLHAFERVLSSYLAFVPFVPRP
jgi:hypothetical protein